MLVPFSTQHYRTLSFFKEPPVVKRKKPEKT